MFSEGRERVDSGQMDYTIWPILEKEIYLVENFQISIFRNTELKLYTDIHKEIGEHLCRSLFFT